MHYTLYYHPESYSLNADDSIGKTYAARHFELAETSAKRQWGHNFIGKIENKCSLAARIEKWIVEMYYSIFKPNERKMNENLFEALEAKKGSEYATKNEIDFTRFPTPLNYSISSHKSKSGRPTQEDHLSVSQTADRIVASVFDGHGGETVSQIGATFFETQFQSTHDPRSDFKRAYRELHQHPDSSFDKMGATAVATCIRNNTAFTGTVGDCEAIIIRRIKGSLKIVPLSPTKTWHTPSEIQRVEKFGDPLFFQQNTDIKLTRYMGMNCARSIGDRTIENSEKSHLPPVISSEPKVTSCQLKPEDLILLYSDGFSDEVPMSVLLQYLEENPHATAEDILKLAPVRIPLVRKRRSSSGDVKPTDNVSVIAIRVGQV